MALLHTPEYVTGFSLPDFRLKTIDGSIITRGDMMGKKGSVVVFICNHCPYVKAIIERLVMDFNILQKEGFAVCAVMPNDTDAYPEDSFENMKVFAREHGFTFPYLIDETQGVAKAFDAICTPDIFGFDDQGILKYRGRLDSSGPNPSDASTVRELVDAMRMIGEAGKAPEIQHASMGCSIKWK